MPGTDLLPDTPFKQQDPRIQPSETAGLYSVSKTSYQGPLQCTPSVPDGMENEIKTYFANVIFVNVQTPYYS